MHMLSPWMQDTSSDARIRVLENSDASQTKNHVARITKTGASVRIRPDDGAHPDWLNWVETAPGVTNIAWCTRMLKNVGYALPEEGLFVIRYNDGAFNMGDQGTDINGFAADLSEASRYDSVEAAMEKLQDLPDAKVVCLRDLRIGMN